jgi:predicted AAA+ superfamily ATPase
MIMERDIYSWLKNWKNEKRRKPLIIRGARQVGKTWLVEYFGKKNFKQFVEINFEFQPHFKTCFSTLNPFEIVEKIELTSNVDINQGITLLFLDEIQECPQALKALRYFYEKMPGLHVIAAGSLLEFVMDAEQISIPVGRIQNIYLHPLSFGEFLTACGEQKIRTYLKNITIST